MDDLDARIDKLREEEERERESKREVRPSVAHAHVLTCSDMRTCVRTHMHMRTCTQT